MTRYQDSIKKKKKVMKINHCCVDLQKENSGPENLETDLHVCIHTLAYMRTDCSIYCTDLIGNHGRKKNETLFTYHTKHLFLVIQ